MGTQNKLVPDMFQECRDMRCPPKEQNQGEAGNSRKCDGDSGDEAWRVTESLGCRGQRWTIKDQGLGYTQAYRG